MPELPEVEVTRQKIAPHLLEREVSRVHTTAASYVFLTPPKTLRRRLKGRRSVQLGRRGKYLLAGLDDGSQLVIHLGMSGQLFLAGARSLRLLSSTSRDSLTPEQQPAFEPDKHTHLRLEFSDAGPDLLFRDVRKFGKLLWLAAGSSDPRLDKLGVDVLEARAADLFDASRGRRVAIKNLLLNQSVLAGVGNIYADEALFGARIHPCRPAGKLSRRDSQRLLRELKRVMLRSIETGGSSISDYIAPDGSDGGYQDERRVYARSGEPCKVCRQPITRIVLGARGTHFCPACQR